MVGSDYPFPLGEDHPGKIIETHEHFTEKQKVLTILKIRNKICMYNFANGRLLNFLLHFVTYSLLAISFCCF